MIKETLKLAGNLAKVSVKHHAKNTNTITVVGLITLGASMGSKDLRTGISYGAITALGLVSHTYFTGITRLGELMEEESNTED